MTTTYTWNNKEMVPRANEMVEMGMQKSVVPGVWHVTLETAKYLGQDWFVKVMTTENGCYVAVDVDGGMMHTSGLTMHDGRKLKYLLALHAEMIRNRNGENGEDGRLESLERLKAEWE